MLKKGLSFALVLILLFSLLPVSVFAGESNDLEDGSNPAGYNGSLADWMADMPDEILLSELNIPGTHDSGTYRTLSEVLYTQCQHMQIDEQLENGIRVFDIRLDCGYLDVVKRWISSDYIIHYMDLNLQHGPYTCFKDISHELYFTDVLNWTQKFLKQHPSETVILKVTNECGVSTGDTGATLVKEALREFCGDYARNYNAICYTGADRAEVPTLGEVRGKILILTDYNGKTLTKYEDHCEELAPEKIEYLQNCFDKSIRLQRFYDPKSTSRPIFRTQNLENAKKGMFGEPDVKFVFTSSNAITKHELYGGPQVIALGSYGEYLPEGSVAVIPWMEEYEFRQGIRYGWILMDFPSECVIRRIIGTNRTAVGQTAYLAVDVDWTDALQSFFFAGKADLYRESINHKRERVPESEYRLDELETVPVAAHMVSSYENPKPRLLHCVFSGLALTDENRDPWYYSIELAGNVAGHWTSSRNEAVSAAGVAPYHVYQYITENCKVSIDSYGEINTTLVDDKTGEVLDCIPFLWNDETREELESEDTEFSPLIVISPWVIKYDQFIDEKEYAVRSAVLNGKPYDGLDMVYERDLNEDEANELVLYVDPAHNVYNRSGSCCTVSENRAVPELMISAELRPELIPEGKVFHRWNILPKDVRIISEAFDPDFSDTEPVEIVFLMPSEDVTVEAVLRDEGDPVPHSVSVTGGEVSVTEAMEDTEITLTAYDSYTFDKWTVLAGGAVLADENNPVTTFDMPYADVEIRGDYKSFHQIDVRGGMVTCYDADRQVSGNDIEGAVVKLDAYINHQAAVFDRWEVNSGSVVIADPYDPNTSFIMPDEDVEITAQYVVPSKRLRSLNVENGSTNIPDGQQAAVDSQIILTAADAPDGEAFDRWDVVKGEVSFTDVNDSVTTITMPDHDVKVVAVYKELHRIYVDDGTASADEATEGTEVTLTAGTVPVGKVFGGWKSFSGYLNFADPASPVTTFRMPNRDVQIGAEFKDYHSIAVDGGTAGADTAFEGNEITVEADPAPDGMEFDCWVILAGNVSLACKYDEATSFFMPDEDVEIKAVYKEAAVPSDGHQIIMFGGRADKDKAKTGDTVTLDANRIQDGKVFDKWEVIPASIEISDPYSASVTLVMPDSDIAARAIYTDAPVPQDPGDEDVYSVYQINIRESAGGSVAADRRSAAAGRMVILTVTPEIGRTLETLTVTDRYGNEPELTNRGGGAYSFSMPESPVTVKATFMEDNTILNYFVDVTAQDWFYDSVLWAAVNGITNGTDAIHFSPDACCTRAQMVTFLWRAAGSPVVDFAMPFTDLETGAYYVEAVRWAASLGITNGTGEHTFSPEREITREQLATLVYNYARTKGQGFAGAWMFRLDYDDVQDIQEYAAEAMAWCVMNGIVRGAGSNLLLPQKTASRAEIVTVLYRYFME